MRARHLRGFSWLFPPIEHRVSEFLIRLLTSLACSTCTVVAQRRHYYRVSADVRLQWFVKLTLSHSSLSQFLPPLKKQNITEPLVLSNMKLFQIQKNQNLTAVHAHISEVPSSVVIKYNLTLCG